MWRNPGRKHRCRYLCNIYASKEYANLHKRKLSHLKAIVVNGEPADAVLMVKCATPVYSWEDFLKLGSEVATEVMEERASSLQPGPLRRLHLHVRHHWAPRRP